MLIHYSCNISLIVLYTIKIIFLHKQYICTEEQIYFVKRILFPNNILDQGKQKKMLENR